MSGGSLNYAYGRVEDTASEIRHRSPDNPLHLAFADHLTKCANALYALEWEYSCDTGPGSADKAIEELVKFKDIEDDAKERIRTLAHQLLMVVGAKGV